MWHQQLLSRRQVPTPGRILVLSSFAYSGSLNEQLAPATRIAYLSRSGTEDELTAAIRRELWSMPTELVRDEVARPWDRVRSPVPAN